MTEQGAYLPRLLASEQFSLELWVQEVGLRKKYLFILHSNALENVYKGLHAIDDKLYRNDPFLVEAASSFQGENSRPSTCLAASQEYASPPIWSI